MADIGRTLATTVAERNSGLEPYRGKRRSARRRYSNRRLREVQVLPPWSADLLDLRLISSSKREIAQHASQSIQNQVVNIRYAPAG